MSARESLNAAIVDGGSGNPEDYVITPQAWLFFAAWYGDKAYREIDFADDWYRAVLAADPIDPRSEAKP